LSEGDVLDKESLCILTGRSVWRLRINIHVLCHDGNVEDTVFLATMGALKHFRLPAVSIDSSKSTNNITQHHSLERTPSPLPLHHSPLLVSYAILSPTESSSSNNTHHHHHHENHTSKHQGKEHMNETSLCVLDPTLSEELICEAQKVCVSVNEHGEICFVEQIGGEISVQHLQAIVQNVTNVHVTRVMRILFQALSEASVQAEQEHTQKMNQLTKQHHDQGEEKKTSSIMQEEGKEEGKDIFDASSQEVDASILDYSVRHVPIALRVREEKKEDLTIEEGKAKPTRK
jgi:exosome complex component RRP45